MVSRVSTMATAAPPPNMSFPLASRSSRTSMNIVKNGVGDYYAADSGRIALRFSPLRLNDHHVETEIGWHQEQCGDRNLDSTVGQHGRAVPASTNKTNRMAKDECVGPTLVDRSEEPKGKCVRFANFLVGQEEAPEDTNPAPVSSQDGCWGNHDCTVIAGHASSGRHNASHQEEKADGGRDAPKAACQEHEEYCTQQKQSLYWSRSEYGQNESERRLLLDKVRELVNKERPDLARTFCSLYQDCVTAATISQVLRTKTARLITSGNEDILMCIRGLESSLSKLFSANRRRHSKKLLSAQKKGCSIEELMFVSMQSSRPSQLVARVFAYGDANQVKRESSVTRR